ncbi:UTRA domain-containing protein [Micromonospora sp. M12]
MAEVQPPADVALALGIADDEPAILRHRLLSSDGEPVELSWSYYPVSIGRGTAIASRQKLAGAPLGHWPSWAILSETSSTDCPSVCRPPKSWRSCRCRHRCR